MTFGHYMPDSSKRGTPTDGAGNLNQITTVASGSLKQKSGSQAPDGSIYLTLTDGAGNNV